MCRIGQAMFNFILSKFAFEVATLHSNLEVDCTRFKLHSKNFFLQVTSGSSFDRDTNPDFENDYVVVVSFE